MPLFLAGTLHAQTGTWTQKADFPSTGRYLAGSFGIGDKGYIVGGLNHPGIGQSNYLADLWAYDPGTDTWTAKASLPGGGRSTFTSFTLNGKGYVLGGAIGSDQYTDELWAYDPGSDAWTAMAPFPPGPRNQAMAFTIGNTAYICCGANETDYFADLWAYDPVNDTWEEKSSVGDIWDTFGAGGMGLTWTNEGFGYVSQMRYLGSAVMEVLRYEVATDSWTVFDPYNMDDFLFSPASFQIGDEVIAAFGQEGDFNLPSQMVYGLDVNMDVWEIMGFHPEMTVIYGSGFTAGNKGYIAAGALNKNLTQYSQALWEYTPSGTTSVVLQGEAMVPPSIYPSPTEGLLTLERSDATEPVQVVLRDALGKELHREVWAAGSEMKRLDLSPQAAGVYLVELVGAQGSTMQRVVRAGN